VRCAYPAYAPARSVGRVSTAHPACMARPVGRTAPQGAPPAPRPNPQGATMSALFSLFRLKDVTLKNRIAVPPMCQYMAEDGFVNDWHQVHYTELARGGAGLVIVEATAVSPEG